MGPRARGGRFMPGNRTYQGHRTTRTLPCPQGCRASRYSLWLLAREPERTGNTVHIHPEIKAPTGAQNALSEGDMSSAPSCSVTARAQPEQERSVRRRGPEVTAKLTQTNTSLHTGTLPVGQGLCPRPAPPSSSGISHSTFHLSPAPNFSPKRSPHSRASSQSAPLTRLHPCTQSRCASPPAQRAQTSPLGQFSQHPPWCHGQTQSVSTATKHPAAGSAVTTTGRTTLLLPGGTTLLLQEGPRSSSRRDQAPG